MTTDNREEKKQERIENGEQLIYLLLLIGRVLFIDTICNP